MARGHVSDTFTPPGIGTFDVGEEIDAIFGTHDDAANVSSPSIPVHSDVSSPVELRVRFGDIAGVIGQQPLATVIKEEAQTVLGHTYKAAAAAASLVLIPGIQLSPSLEVRVGTLEKIVANVTGQNGTIDHIFNSLNTVNENVNALREEVDCRTMPGAVGSPNTSSDSVGYVNAGKQRKFQYVWPRSPLPSTAWTSRS